MNGNAVSARNEKSNCAKVPFCSAVITFSLVQKQKPKQKASNPQTFNRNN